METDQSIKKHVGKVTAEERDEILALFERKNGLSELFLILTNSSTETNMYERLVNDMSKVTSNMRTWWENKSKKYKWENISGYKWEIDFNTCEIYLIKGQ